MTDFYYLTIGDTLPQSLKLKDDENRDFFIKDLYGKPTILYFYPKDDTPGCTAEACDFRDNFAEFKKADFQLIGVSPDSSESHKKFKDKYSLNFKLLSDPEREMSTLLGVYREMNKYGKMVFGIQRSTFLISKDLKIEKELRNVRAKGHVGRLLAEWCK
jgi:thioredoxin-dependent peroxiredoxin